MSSTATALSGSYDYLLVALSVVIAILAAYAALDFAGRVTAAQGSLRLIRLIGGARFDGRGHLVHALRRDARVSAADSGAVRLADGAAVIARRHSRLGGGVVCRES